MPNTPDDIILDDEEMIESITMPLMALRGLTVFPGMVITFEVERKKSKAALNAAAESSSREIFLVTQKDILVDDPGFDDLYPVGTVCAVRQLVKQPDGKINVMVEGKSRAELICADFTARPPEGGALIITTKSIEEPAPKVEALLRHVTAMFERYVDMLGNALPESVVSFSMKREVGYVADYITQNMLLRYPEKQAVLETIDPVSRLKVVSDLLAHELEVLSFQRDIGRKLHDEMSRNHRDNFLREQLRLIKSELGEEPSADEDDEYRDKIKALGLEADVEKKLLKEVDKLARQPFGSQEGAVIRSYLDLCVELPWKTGTKERIDLDAARKVLDKEHFGLDKVKERIIEHLAVLKLRGDMKSPIVCLYGPPGVGKTSLGKSIAEALNRKYIRISLGGLHDEAEIRGHRRTYIGAMPGRIMQGLIKAKSSNPVFVLDEIDKIGNDFKGDPASALLEVLDPEQNNAFHDNYVDVDYDLSKILFIATANNLNSISQPLLDRMELIDISGYIIEEKVEIGMRHLVPKQLENHGLKKGDVVIPKKVMAAIVDQYTRESGVRELDKKIARIMRKVARLKASEKEYNPTLSPEDLREYLGAREYNRDKYENNDYAGVVTGLAWTAVGGEILFVESSLSKSKNEKLTLTGNLGDVMKESAVIALQYIKSHAASLGINDEIFDKWAVHVHVPEGAIPKDGPSAGITMATSLASAFTQRKVKDHLAMTGEITLRGKVLPVGGIKEKILAAKRASIKEIVLSEENRKDIEEIKEVYLKGLTFHYVKNINDVLKVALTDQKVKNAIDIN